MKKHTVKKKKRMINAHAWVLAVISFILALTVGEIVVAVFQYFNNINHIADDALLMQDCPGGTPEQTLRRTAYVTSYNKATKLPNWVAWRLTPDRTSGPAKRSGVSSNTSP